MKSTVVCAKINTILLYSISDYSLLTTDH